jgi:sensor domain CHASE-containing protein
MVIKAKYKSIFLLLIIGVGLESVVSVYISSR